MYIRAKAGRVWGAELGFSVTLFSAAFPQAQWGFDWGWGRLGLSELLGGHRGSKGLER